MHLALPQAGPLVQASFATDDPHAPELPQAAPAGSDTVAAKPQPDAPTAVKPAYVPAAARPTQAGPDGILFDFNFGARIELPQGSNWRIRLTDRDTGNTLFESRNAGAMIHSTKRYFVPFHLEVWRDDQPVFEHVLDCRGRDVLVQFPVGTLGDVLAWFPYAVAFARERGCRLTCAMSGLIAPLLSPAHPDIRFVTHEELSEQRLAEGFYATYCLGLFFDDADHHWQPCDFRFVGLGHTAGFILGIERTDAAPVLSLPDETRPIAEPYVVIAAQSSSQAKYWNNPDGWRAVIAMLKQAGYRVVCIDQKAAHGTGLVWNHLPHGAEDETGDRPLAERARWLRHAAAFVGLSSGLSWLAWACGTPVVMISGFTHPSNEFDTPFRVINYHACNSCWNDPRVRFDHHDFLWCPRHAGTARQFECTRLITAHQVTSAIARIPGLIPLPLG